MQQLKLTVYSNGAVLLLSPADAVTVGSRSIDPRPPAPKAKMMVQWSGEKPCRRRMTMNGSRPFPRAFYDDETLASPVLG